MIGPDVVEQRNKDDQTRDIEMIHGACVELVERDTVYNRVAAV
jgi:hypothetical protein